VTDTGFPLTTFVTGANVHDSQLAIPTGQLTEKKVSFVLITAVICLAAPKYLRLFI
jgi:hypothetical protein